MTARPSPSAHGLARETDAANGRSTLVRTTRRRRYLEIVEAVYDPEPTMGPWLHGIAEAARRCFGSPLGAFAYRFDVSERHLAMDELVASGPTHVDVAHRVWQRMQLTHQMEMLDAFYAPEPTALLASEVLARAGLTEAAREGLGELRRAGIEDVLGIRVVEPDGRGLVLAVLLHCKTTLPPRTRASCSRVADHLRAAWRMRVMEAERVPIDRNWLFEPPQHSTAADAQERRELWDALMSGDWEVIGSRDDGPERTLLLRRRVRKRANIIGLNARERAVAALAGDGHSLKYIAHELQLAPSTVTEHLQRALEKLGLDHRVELVRLAVLLRRSTDDPKGSLRAAR
jgi:DNA-binding CsgD family transcriptional regulator